MKNILDIIESIDNKHPNVNPTEIYNEGWMTRLLIYHSLKNKIKIKGIDFSKISNWTSEALISSPFIRAPKNKEGYTHADMALGDFDVNYVDRGEIQVLENAKFFGIIEAKMGSNLSQGTTHAKNYDQASRNLACIAYNTYNHDCDIFFAVVAPKIKLKEHKIDKLVDVDSMVKVIKERFKEYDAQFKNDVHMESVIAKAETCKTWVVSYEDWIDSFCKRRTKKALLGFYQKALKWNRIS